MSWWKRQFGLHPIDVVVHFVVGGFLVAGLEEATHSDSVALLATAAMFVAYAWRRQRAINKFEATGMSSGEVKLAELDAQAEEIHELRTRLAELEERVDFSERMLARQSELEKLPGERL